MRLLQAVAVVTLLALQDSRAAAQPAGSVEVGAYGQVTRVAPEQARFQTLTPLSMGVRGRVNLHRGLGVELEASTSTVEGAGDVPRRRYNQLVARGTWTIPLSEFSGLLVGAGVARSDYELTYNFGADALLGVRTVISGRYVLRSDAIFNYLPTSGATEFAIRTGLQAVIGPFDGPTTRDRRRGNLTMQEPGSIEAGLIAQQWWLHPGWNLRSGGAIGTRVGAFLTSRSQVEVEATYGRQTVRDGGRPGSTGALLPAGQTFRVTTFSVRFAHQLPVGRRYAIVAAAGPSRSSYEYTDHWGGSGILGGRVALTRDIQLRADIVGNYLIRPRVMDTGVRVGVSTLLRFGR